MGQLVFGSDVPTWSWARHELLALSFNLVGLGEGIRTNCKGFLKNSFILMICLSLEMFRFNRKITVTEHLQGLIGLRRDCCAKAFGKLHCNLKICQTTVSEKLDLAVGFSNMADVS